MREGGLHGESKPIKITYQSELIIGDYPTDEPAKAPVLEKQGSVYAIPNTITVISASGLVTGDVLGKGASGTVYSLMPPEQGVVKFVSTELGKPW